jgi:hypothetical protein
MDKYLSGLYGSCSIINWITNNKGKHFLDMVTMSDIAYTVAVIKNSYKEGDEEHGIDNDGEGEEQEVYRRPQKKVKMKFTNRVGKKRQCNMSRWSNDGIHFYNSVRASWRALSQDTTWTTFEEEWAAYKDKTNFSHSSTKKKDEHEEPEDDYYYDGGEQCPDLPLWDKFVLLDGDEDFTDERLSSKRMREDLNQDGDESDCLSLLGDDDGEHGEHQAWMPRVSLNSDGDSNGDNDGEGDGDSDGDVAV